MASNIFLENEEIKAILSPDDPECLFTDLEQIGHGNFGAVYCAKDTRDQSIVAIKKLNCSKKQLETKLGEIALELKVMKRIKHENAVSLRDVFGKNMTVWLVMEFCLGSLIDIMSALKQPFNERIIGLIGRSVLKALVFVHSFGWIHRDLKGANILVSRDSTIKLADFGSTSLKDPANTFIGSPYWMAPEVILAMEDGVYGRKCDIWSFGITLIELAESKPPLFEMNAMSALYYIAQNEPPQLTKSADWSESFSILLKKCLQKDPEQRPEAADILTMDFLAIRSGDKDEMLEIIDQCFHKVAAINEENYEKIKTYVRQFDPETPSDISNSMTSVNSQNESNTSKYKKKRFFKSSRKNNTIKMNATIVQEMIYHESDMFQDNLVEYRLMRRNLSNQVLMLNNKLKLQRSEMIKTHEKELELILSNLEKNVEKLRQKQFLEYEQLLKAQINVEKKVIRSLNISKTKKKLANFNPCKYFEIFTLRQTQAKERLEHVHKCTYEILNLTRLEKKNYYNKKISNSKIINGLLKDHNQQLINLKLNHMEQIQNFELSNICSHGKKSEIQLRKKHISELKQKPKTLKSVEALLRKSQSEQIKLETLVFKKMLEEAQLQNSKEEFLKMKHQIKLDRVKKLTKFEEEIKDLIAKKTLEIEIELETVQIKEVEELAKKN